MVARIGRLVAGAAVLMLAACGGMHERPPLAPSYLPPWQRVQTPVECTTFPCRVPIDPDQPQWVAEYVVANRGGVIHFEIVNTKYEFDREGIFFKPVPGGAGIDCHAEGTRHKRVCRIGPQSPERVALPYGILIKGKPPYDPYVWNR